MPLGLSQCNFWRDASATVPSGSTSLNDDRDTGGSHRKGGEGGPGNWLALLLLLALAAVEIIIVNEIIKQVNIQNCVLSGRKDCVEIVPPAQ